MALGVTATEEQRDALRADLGLDRSLPVQYLSWLRGFLTGSPARSIRFQSVSVADLLLERLPVTGALAGLSLLLIILIAVPLALLSALKEHSAMDRLVNALSAVTIAVPGFFLGILFVWVFAGFFRLFTPGSYVSYKESAAGFLGCLFLPSLAVALPNAAMALQFLRSSIKAEMRSAYVRTAYGKGASTGAVLCRHVLKNAAAPAVTLLGMIIGDIFSGSIVIEQVFSIPGLGRLLIASVVSRDYPLAQTLAAYAAFIMVMANTVSDMAVRLIDPRVRERR
jgi:ABC-type dipeptide/oligopeptide/nickel transport system permease component